jgi:2-polyprenyl-3-methyl-5-hydroxy-6-metoxy-1,4-benzoquinol methylase
MSEVRSRATAPAAICGAAATVDALPPLKPVLQRAGHASRLGAFRNRKRRAEKMSDYALGHGDSELERLLLQAEVWGAFTDALLRRTGLREGMRVLDLGTGTGDVALLAARIVGAEGEVIGIDRAPEPLRLAALRAGKAGLTNVRFEVADIHTFEPAGRFDAIAGRFILLHAPDPVAVLRRLSLSLAPDGVLILQEPDISAARTTPPVPLFAQSVRWVVEGLERAGARGDLGSLLWSILRRTGVREPALAHDARIEPPPGELGCRYLAQTVTSLLPVIQMTGLATADEIGPDTLEQRLLRDVTAAQAVMVSPALIGAWGRLG